MHKKFNRKLSNISMKISRSLGHSENKITLYSTSEGLFLLYKEYGKVIGLGTFEKRKEVIAFLKGMYEMRKLLYTLGMMK